jgi:serine/threonine protein kinase
MRLGTTAATRSRVEPTPGMMITPMLRLVHPLGSGAMGSVWVADHLGLGSRVAVKFMAPELAQSPEMAERFRREAASAAKIRSPHVVRIFDHGVSRLRLPYIAMELLDGESLQERLARVGRLDLRETAVIAAQVGEVLGRASEAGVVHRDIKPANLFLVRSAFDTQVKVLDFGLARSPLQGASLTSTGTMLGSPLYMSPEQLTNARAVDTRADVWALAVVIYQALTGQHPFIGQSLPLLMVAIAQRAYRPPRSLRPDLPAALDLFFERAFAADLDRRFQRAGDLVAALLGIAYGDSHSGARTAVLDAPLPAARPTDFARTVALDDEMLTRPTIPPSPAPAPAALPPWATAHPITLRPKRSWSHITGIVLAAIGLSTMAAAGGVVLTRSSSTATTTYGTARTGVLTNGQRVAPSASLDAAARQAK